MRLTAQARKGYALHRMCFSFNAAEHREAFRRDEEGYMRSYGLDVQDLGAAQTGMSKEVHANYHIPISNTAAGMMALEPA